MEPTRQVTPLTRELTIHTYPWLTTDAQALLDENAALRAELWNVNDEGRRYIVKNMDLKAENERLHKQWSEAAIQRVGTIEELRVENERLKDELENNIHEQIHQQQEVADLRAQLAQVERERDEWNKKHLSLCHVVIELREQLAASEAKVKELEKVAR